MNAPLVRAHDVVIARGARAVVDGVSLELQSGTLTALLGPNGAGKSSLVAGLLGALPLVRGTVELRGQPLLGLASAARALLVAALAQDERPDPGLSALDVALLGRVPRRGPWGLPDAADVAAAKTALERVDLLAVADRTVGTLSGGERQRALLARVLCQDAPIILVDEPTHALDPGHALAAMAQLQREADRGAAVLVVMHDLLLAIRTCPRAVLMADGHVVATGPTQEVLSADHLRATYGVDARVIEVDGRRGLVMG